MTPPFVSRSIRVENQIRSGKRVFAVFAILAVMLPLALFGLLERQAKRLEALGDHGSLGLGTVTARREHTTYYAYEVEGKTHTWSVAEEEANYAVGTSFPIVYLPEDPSLNRPGSDRTVGTREAAKNRRFSWKLAFGVFYFFGSFLLMTTLQLRRFRINGDAEFTDPEGPKRRLRTNVAIMAPLLGGVIVWHFVDASGRGESTAPVFISAVVIVAILVGTYAFMFRKGPEQAQKRHTQILKYVAPAAIAIAVLRVIIELVGK